MQGWANKAALFSEQQKLSYARCPVAACKPQCAANQLSELARADNSGGTIDEAGLCKIC